MFIDFVVMGPPKPWQRAGRAGQASFTAPATRRYQLAVKTMSAIARDSAGLHALWPKDARYRVEIAVMFADQRRRDIDNVCKSVLDAMNKVLYADDSQVYELSIVRHTDSQEPRTHVRVEVLA